MSDRQVIGSPGAAPEAGTPRTRRRLPLHIAEIQEVPGPPAPPPLPGHLCEACFDAPAVLVVPAPGGGDMGICAACQQDAASSDAPGAQGGGGPADALASDPRRGPAGGLPCGRGAPAGLVGSLRRDCASPYLPLWELSVTLGRGRAVP